MDRMKWLIFFVVISRNSAAYLQYTVAKEESHPFQKYDPEMDMNVPEMIQYLGYPVEIHTITTEDGYILECHRIPHGRVEITGPRTPVMVQHGLLSSSADFVTNFPNQSLGFMLADAGYDVWLTNARGNTYGRKHTTLNPDRDLKFWHFSWDEMAKYDAPGYIDYILKQTNYTQLYYIGHSMGTTIAFAMMSTKPEYNDKIKLMLGLGPVTTVTYMISPVIYLAPYATELAIIAKLFGIGEFLPSGWLAKFLAKGCSNILEEVCEDVMFDIMGYDPIELNGTRMGVYMSHAPAGISTMTILHYAQEYRAQKFQHCDWGIRENLKRYGQFRPPEYKMETITAPVALFWGANDLMADPMDVDYLSRALPNLVGSYQVGGPRWSHLDFIWGIDDGPKLNQGLIKMMPRF